MEMGSPKTTAPGKNDLPGYSMDNSLSIGKTPLVKLNRIVGPEATVLAMFGAGLILTPGAVGMSGAIKRAEENAGSDPDRYSLPQQFKKPANPEIYERTTGPEILNDTGGAVPVHRAFRRCRRMKSVLSGRSLYRDQRSRKENP
jgi:hypothetical protein